MKKLATWCLVGCALSIAVVAVMAGESPSKGRGSGRTRAATSDAASAAINTANRVRIIAAGTTLVESTDVPHAIPDDNPVGVTSTLTGPSGTIVDINLHISRLPHTYVGDLHFELTSPSGTTVVLILNVPEGGLFDGQPTQADDDFIGTILDDQSPTNLPAGPAPFTGSYNIEHPSVATNPLSAFNGEEAAGTWTLHVSDRWGEDIGTLEGWGIEFDFEADCTCPLLCALQDAADGLSSLATLRKFRDEVLAKSVRGRRYTKEYYRHGAAVVGILAQSPGLANDARRLVKRFLPHLRATLNGNSARVSSRDYDAAEQLLSQISSHASPKLQASIRRLLSDIHSGTVDSFFTVRQVHSNRHIVALSR